MNAKAPAISGLTQIIERGTIFPKDVAHKVVRAAHNALREDNRFSTLAPSLCTHVVSVQQGQENLPAWQHSVATVLYAYGWRHLQYTPDLFGLEKLINPSQLLDLIAQQEKAGIQPPKAPEDCDGIASFQMTMLASMGLHTRVKLVALKPHPPTEYRHIFAESWVDRIGGTGGWLMNDPTLPPDECRVLEERIIEETAYIVELPA